MKIAVRYYSRSGNTKKIALAIADAVGVEALDVSHKLDEDVDILFLGSAVYAAGVDNEIKSFISNIDVNVGRVVNFSTSAVLESTYNQVKKLLDAKGINIDAKNFACRGKFMMAHRNKPDTNDLAKAAAFAKGFLED